MKTNVAFGRLFAATFLTLLTLLFSTQESGAQTVNMSNGSSVVTCGGPPIQFFDSGGSGGNYSANQTLTYTFCPNNAAQVLRVQFTGTFSLAYQDAFLTIYDGSDVSAPPIASLTGTANPAGYKFSSARPGNCLTFQFISGPATPLGGWGAAISCVNVSGISAPVFIHATQLQQNYPTGQCNVNTCAGTYFDDGGKTSSYSSNVGGVYEVSRTFCPDIPGNCLKADVTSFAVRSLGANGDFDQFTVYNAPNVADGSTIIDTYNNDNPPPASWTSSAPSGCLTFGFYSDNLGTAGGWEIAFSCVPCAASQQTAGNNNDCAYAVNPAIVCGDATGFNEVGIGPGLSPDGCNGCALSESYTNWYRIRTTTAGKISFNIASPEDYDFAMYGPFPPGGGCNNLGVPLRCSYAGSSGNTGLTSTATDKSEDVSGNGFVSQVDGVANMDYLIVVNRWTPGVQSFTLDVPDCNYPVVDPSKACLECIPLGPEIAFFRGLAFSGYNELKWQTARAYNAVNYSIEKKEKDAWREINRLKSQGDNATYSVSDPRPTAGSNLYRLKAIDRDGSEHVLGVVVEVMANIKTAPFNVYYDSNEGSMLLFLSRGARTEDFRVFDSFGRLTVRYDLPKENETALKIQYVLNELPRGIYYAKIGEHTVKFFKE